MKKRCIIWIAAIVLALGAAAAVTATVVTTSRSAEVAASEQAAVYEAYIALRDRAKALTLSVEEDGKPVGTYSLAQLGVLPDTLAAIDAKYRVHERMTPEEFAALPLKERLTWHETAHPGAVSLPVPMASFYASPVLRDLQALPRNAAKNAYITFADGSYIVNPEVPGTQLHEDAVRAALTQCAAGLVISSDAANVVFEVTDCNCYLPAEITTEQNHFDFTAELAEDVQNVRVSVEFLNGAEVLEGAQLAALVRAGEDGRLTVDRDALDDIVAGWAETYNTYGTPYLFDSYVGGPTPIEFLTVDYEVQTASLADAIAAQLLMLESGTCTATYDCYDEDGNPFGIENTYVEVDIPNQHLAFYQDGELVVATDIVTGRLGGWKTPTGLYSSYDKQVNRWLIGEDYAVFVKYWVRIFGHYGLHDASWRTIFGGDQYKVNGSHGCVNIPEEAMAVIYEKIVDGTPVLVF